MFFYSKEMKATHIYLQFKHCCIRRTLSYHNVWNIMNNPCCWIEFISCVSEYIAYKYIILLRFLSSHISLWRCRTRWNLIETNFIVDCAFHISQFRCGNRIILLILFWIHSRESEVFHWIIFKDSVIIQVRKTKTSA